MFEDSTRQQAGGRRSFWPLALSVALHLGAVAALAIAAARAPAADAGDQPIDVLFLHAALQDTASAAKQPSAAEIRAERDRQAMLDKLVQPEAIPEGRPAQDGAPPPGTGSSGNGPTGAPSVPDPAAAVANLPVAAGGDIVRPEVIETSRVDPIYPPDALRDGFEGLVVLEASIDDRGKVGDLEVVRGLGHGFEEAAIAAVRRWRFHPATRNGHPLAVRLMIPILFRR